MTAPVVQARVTRVYDRIAPIYRIDADEVERDGIWREIVAWLS